MNFLVFFMEKIFVFIYYKILRKIYVFFLYVKYFFKNLDDYVYFVLKFKLGLY